MKNLFVLTLMAFALAVASSKARAQSNSKAQEIGLINQTNFKPIIDGFKAYNSELRN